MQESLVPLAEVALHDNLSWSHFRREARAALVAASEFEDVRRRVVKVVGFVHAVDGFKEQPAVINGASDLLLKLFGDRGRHARSAVGVRSLPSDVSVELELIVEVED